MQIIRCARVAILLSASFLSGVALADGQFQKPDDAIRYRKSVFDVISVQFGAINQALTKGPMVQKDVEHEAELVQSLASLPWTAFLPGTLIPAQSRARPEIWKDAAGFKKASDDFVLKATALASAAKAGDKAAIKSAFDDTAKSCEDCHNHYRVK